MHVSLRLVVCLLVATVLGCSTSHQYSRFELVHLDGFYAEEEDHLVERSEETPRFEITALSGEVVTFDGRTELILHEADSEVIRHQFERVEVVEDTFVGTTDDGRIVEVPLEAIEAVETARAQPGRTAFLVATLSVIGVATVLVATLPGPDSGCGFTCLEL